MIKCNKIQNHDGSWVGKCLIQRLVYFKSFKNYFQTSSWLIITLEVELQGQLFNVCYLDMVVSQTRVTPVWMHGYLLSNNIT